MLANATNVENQVTLLENVEVKDYLKEGVVQDLDPKIERKRKAEDTDLKVANLHMPRKKIRKNINLTKNTKRAKRNITALTRTPPIDTDLSNDDRRCINLKFY